MGVKQNYKGQSFKKYTQIGLAIGLLVGGTVGFVAGGSMLMLFGASLTYALGVMTVFSVIFAGFGSFMGLMFDIDARERGVRQSRPIVAQPRRVRRQRVKTQPLQFFL